MAASSRVPAELHAAVAKGKWYSVDVVVDDAGGAMTSDELLRLVEDAVGQADRAARERMPEHPARGAVDYGVAGSCLVALSNPTRSEQEALAWLDELVEALSGTPAMQVRPFIRPRRIATGEDLWEAPPALAGFAQLTTSHETRTTSGPPSGVLTETTDEIRDWLRFPGADLSYVRNRGVRRVAPADFPRELLVRWPDDPIRIFAADLKSPRRRRSLLIGPKAEAHMQVIDTSRSPVDNLAVLIEGLKICAPWAELGFVRHASPAMPDLWDIPYHLARQPTPQENALASGRIDHLLGEYVAEASVAQVLTASHLAKARDLEDFHVEPLPAGRFLVQAKDPEPWVRDINPDPAVLQRAREAFGDMIVTEETIATTVEPWRRNL
ncbi:hypothetical protein JQN72_02130 [Phycicoccus sp. CSK15P-2]|uniref:hypothetical protein n=1 Tax=Phycicoccus sp. CSK15P-2 TaxID=2807627 RepID=UPI001951E1C6|nr:hypothetical protein [Phycicoccus sp. CSK15P-2]MBM6403047.1 hypothetical protein [Phycicoccus sp. CSK15P-2]